MKTRLNQVLVGGIAGAIAIAAATPPSLAGTLYNGWNYIIDAGYDSLGGETGTVVAGGTIYEIYGMAIKDDIDTNSIWIALNANLPIEGHVTGPTVTTDGITYPVRNDSITWGDLFFDFSGTGNFKNASDTNSLYAVRFAEPNDSTVRELGVYSGVSGIGVARENAGYWHLTSHNNKLIELSGREANMGDLAWNDPYYSPYTNPSPNPNLIPNVIDSGTKIGDIEFVETLDLIARGFDVNFLPEQGSQTIGFRFDKSLFPSAEYIATLITECVNDGLTAIGNFIAPPPPPPPPPPPSTCIITPGQMNPLQPDFVKGKTKGFNNVVSGEWYDPPASMEVMYEVLPPSLITAILDFPCGIDTDDLFTVSVGGIELGQFQPGDQLIFSEFEALLNGLLIDGIGVESLVISDIDIPNQDTADPADFYVKLGFSTPTADVRITQVPEPSAGLGVFALAGLGIVARARRKK